MALSITNIGTGSVVATSTFAVRAPPGNIPAGVIVFCVICDGSSVAGSITDSSGNVYTNITAVQGGTLFGWFSGNVISISRGGSGISYSQHAIGTGAMGSFVYISGTPPSHFLDTLVSAKVTGGFTSQPTNLTSGPASIAGEAFFAAAAAVFTGSSVGTYNQPAPWVTPPNAITLIPAGGTQTFSLGAGSRINSGTGAFSYQPTFSLVPTTWATFILAFTSAVSSQVLLGGAGSLAVNVLAPMQFGVAIFSGVGSLKASMGFVLAVSAEFDGSGILNATAVQGQQAAAAFNGAGNLAASVIQVHAQQGSSAFNGSGSLSASVVSAEAASAVFAGAGLMAVGVQVINVPQEFIGFGSLSALATIPGKVAITLQGVGSLQASTLTGAAAASIFGGIGSLTSSFVPTSTLLNGVGSLTAITQQVATANTVNARIGAVGEFSLGQQQQLFSMFVQAAKFSGSGSLTANTVQHSATTAAKFDGSGRMCAFAETLIGTPGQTTNDVCPGPGPTENTVASGIVNIPPPASSIPPPPPPPPPGPVWILSDGTWDDDGVWDDNAVWID